MKKKIFLIVSVVLIILLSLIYFVFNKNEKVITTNNKNNQLVITDTSDKQVIFNETPERVISLIPAATEIIYDLNSQDKIIAVDNYSNYPEDTKNKTKLLTNTSLNIESIINLNPDVVFMSKMGQTIEQYNNLINSGIKVVMVDAKSLEETYHMINLIGKVLNKEKEAKVIVDQMKKDFNEIQYSLKDKVSKNVYYEISPLQYGLWTSGNNTFENDIMKILNISNIFNDIDGWKQISEEQILTRNPEYIITTSMDMKDLKAVDEIKNRKNWNKVKAIKLNQVYNINPDIMSRPTKRLVEGAKELKKLIYGE